MTLTKQIIALREHGLKYQEIAELLDSTEGNCRVLYWYYRNKEKRNFLARNWRNKNKEHYKSYRKKWYDNNIEKRQKYSYNKKCKEAGVKPMELRS